MEDSTRPLPTGWVRQWDAQTNHQFFVDTKSSPPRSIWWHPYDDEQYMRSLPDAERQRIQSLHRVHSISDIEAESSDDDTHHGQRPTQPGGMQDTGPEKLSAGHKFGRKLKDKLTGSTHQERATKRQQRAEAERQAHYVHQQIALGMSRAIDTGEPQLIGKDKDGREIWIEPPGGLGGRGLGDGAYGVNPWSNGYFGGGYPGAMYARPMGPYSRPYGRGNYGYGYGGGLGMGTLGLGAGLGLGAAGIMAMGMF